MTFSRPRWRRLWGPAPYKVKRAKPGTYIEYERVEDYWAADLPFARGLNNFDTLRIEFYRDRQAAFEAFKKGKITFREEFTSKVWATEYDFPAMEDGRAKKQLFDAEKVPSFQAWAVNQRRTKFAHPKTAQAIGHCFDFEWTNENFFYNSYKRGQSFFENSEFSASGVPQGAELDLLKQLKKRTQPFCFRAGALAAQIRRIGPRPKAPANSQHPAEGGRMDPQGIAIGGFGWKATGNRIPDTLTHIRENSRQVRLQSEDAGGYCFHSAGRSRAVPKTPGHL